MQSVEQLAAAEAKYATEIGYMVMQAAAVDMELRFIAISLAEPVDRRLHDRLKNGWGQATRIAGEIKRLAPGHFDEVDLKELVAAVDQAVGLLDQRGDLSHSTWPQSIFDETPEPARLSQRDLKMHRTTLGEIYDLRRRLQGSATRLIDIHSKLFLFVPWSHLDEGESGPNNGDDC